MKKGVNKLKISEESQSVALALLTKGEENLNKSNFIEAFNHFKLATEVDPEMVDAWIHLGNCYRYGWGIAFLNPRKAFDCYERATQVDPKHKMGWFYLGCCYRDNFGVGRDVESALNCFKKVKELDPDFILLLAAIVENQSANPFAMPQVKSGLFESENSRKNAPILAAASSARGNFQAPEAIARCDATSTVFPRVTWYKDLIWSADRGAHTENHPSMEQGSATFAASQYRHK